MTSDISLTLEEPAPELDLEKIDSELIRHAAEMGIERNPLSLHLVFRDSSGLMVAGLKARTCYGWLGILQLWVEKEFRGQGLGTRLMQEAEKIALERGCANAYTDTYSFQAPQFYLKLGYEVFGELKDIPPGQSKYYLRKSLKSDQKI